MKICLECEGISDTQRDECASCGIRLSDTAAVHFPLRRGEADAANPLLGTVIDGKYQVQGVLGKGGMGTVFRAIHQVSLIPVALKILNPRFSVRGEYRDYFLAEAQKAGRVTHEHAGRILDVGEAEDGTVYIAMEEVHGVTLEECIHGDVPLAPAVVVDILEQICQALAAAHHAGIVHRDLSPRNVMVVVRQGRPFVKILDFGIAKGLPHAAPVDTEGAEVSLAPTGFASPPYSAPEHLEGKDVDARADLYSVGVIAYEALTQELPVAGTTPQERAEATIHGEVEPMPAVPGVPARLVRLVRSLMSVDPNDRPSSAEEVRLALHSIGQPGSRLLRDVAVLLFILAVVVCGFAYSRTDDPVLAKRSGSLVVGASAEEVPEPQYLQSAQLAVLRFDFTGFAAGDLMAEVVREGERLSVDALGAQEVDGVLVLDRDASPEYEKFLALLERKCRDGAVLITFQLKGGAALGVANVLVDDTVPRLELKHEGPAGTLNDASTLHIDCSDHGGVSGLLLECRRGGLTIYGPRDIESKLDRGTLKIRASALLRQIQGGDAMPVKDVSLLLTATDRAGNTAAIPVTRFDIDFDLPDVTGGDEVSATLLENKATLSFELTQRDVGLSIEMRTHGEGATPFTPLQSEVIEKQINVDLPKLQNTVELEFRLRDGAGNTTDFTRRVTFFSRMTGLELVESPALASRLQPLGKGLVWSGTEAEFGFRCNPFYKPVAVTLRGTTVDVQLTDARRGAGRIRVAGARGLDKDVRLDITLEPDTLNPVVTVASWDLKIQSSPLRLELPDTSGMRFFSQLTADDGLFEEPEGGTFDQRDNWRLVPPDARLLRGRIGWGSGGSDLPGLDLPECENPNDRFFQNQRLLRGYNVLYLLLRDVFGREVEVTVGGAPASKLATGPMRGAARIAEFQYEQEVARVQADALKLEYQQKTRVIFHSDYTFDAADQEQISLVFQTNPVACVGLRPRSDGTDLIFDLDYGEMARAAGKAPDAVELKRGEFEFEINLALRTPAGSREFKDANRIRVETTRSSLVQVRLGGRVAGLDPVLGAIEMVPVLSPLAEFPDRVPRALRIAGGFLRRREIPVQNLQDCYLQQDELTKAQYWAIVRSFRALPDARRPAASLVCFAGDPAGDGRLSESGMVPMTFGSDPARWRRELTTEPDGPVTGISFYQAHAVAKMAGVVLFGDAACFRLPFGVELEVAALGRYEPGVLNGVAGTRLAELRRGDRVTTPLGDEIRGLDFGVREWVMDLPWPVGDLDGIQKQIVSGWLADHATHQDRATGVAAMPPPLRARLQPTGVVRGITLADRAKLADLVTKVPSRDDRPLGNAVAGVVRTVHVRRDGRGLLPGKPHRLLSSIGMRLAGGEPFVKKVRTR